MAARMQAWVQLVPPIGHGGREDVVAVLAVAAL